MISQIEKKPGTALVLSGGATKAFYFHLGVLKVLHPEKITSIAGSSAGAILGAFVASGATIDDMITSLYQKQVYLPKFDAWVKTLNSTMLFRPRYKDITRQSLFTACNSLKFLASLPRLYNNDVVGEVLDMLVKSQTQISGFFDAVAVENLFKSLLPSADFADTEIDLYVTGTCLDHLKRAVFNSRYSFEDDENDFMTDVPIHKAVHASTSIPGLFEPVKIKGKYYIDGEVKKTLSADIGFSLADKVIISHTYQPLDLGGDSSVKDLGWVSVLKQSTAIFFHERIAIWRKIYEQQFPDKEVIWIQPEADDLEFFMAPEFSFHPDVQKQIIKSGEIAALRMLNKPERQKV